jgi:hypothetical protein
MITQQKQINYERNEVVTFYVNEFVWMSMLDLNKKQKHIGPFRIVRTFGGGMFELDLPAYLEVNRVVHVSELTKYINNNDNYKCTIPEQLNENINSNPGPKVDV